MKLNLQLASDNGVSLTSVALQTINNQNSSGPPPSGFIKQWDASAITGVSNGSGVGAWTGTNGTVFSQATGADQPQYLLAGLGGLPILRFNGTTSYMATPNINVPFAAQLALVVLARLNNSPAASSPGILFTYNNGALEVRTSNDTSGGVAQVAVGGSGCEDSVSCTGAWHSFIAFCTGSADFLFKDGVQVGTHADTPNLPLTDPLGIGGRGVGSVNGQWDIAEMFLDASVMTADRIAAYHNYFLSKWGAG